MPSYTRSRRFKEPIVPRMPRDLITAELPRHDLRDDERYQSLEYTGIDLSHRDVDSAEFERCRFHDTSLSGSVVARVGFSSVEISRCDLSNSQARSASVTAVSISSSRLTGMALVEAGFHGVLFDTCRGDLANFRFGTFRNVIFRNCLMTESNFQEADLRGVRFEKCKLNLSQFSNAKMEDVIFTECEMMGIGGVTSLRGATIQTLDAYALAQTLASAIGIVLDQP
jgi:uncharacterized protein YjbI with pentapeptide repeats